MSGAPRAAWIIGGSSGIGRALALRLANRGTRVVVSARDEDALAEVARSRPDTISGVALDLLDDVSVADAMHRIRDDVGTLDLVICSAAYWRMGNLEETATSDLKRTLDTNVVAPFDVIKRCLDLELLAPGARIALLSSVAGFNGLPNAVAYGTSKAALTHMAESLRFDLERLGYRLTVVHPGFVDTPMTAENPFPMPFIVSSETAAARIVDGLDAGRFEIVFPRRLAWPLKILRMLPYGLSFGLLKRATGGSGA